MARTGKGHWLEIIKIRSPRDVQGVVKNVIRTVKSDPTMRATREMRVFTNGAGDIAIHLAWRPDGIAPCGSLIGFQLAVVLSEYGLINHTMWIEEV